jgi:hypothetical protein
MGFSKETPLSDGGTRRKSVDSLQDAIGTSHPPNTSIAIKSPHETVRIQKTRLL